MTKVNISNKSELTDVAWLPTNVEVEHIKDQPGPRRRITQGDSEVAEFVHDFRNTPGVGSMLSELIMPPTEPACYRAM